jgi:hypothetical protein
MLNPVALHSHHEGDSTCSTPKKNCLITFT